MALTPGLLTGEQLRACWPALRPHVVEAVKGQPEDVRAAMDVVLRSFDQSPVTFTVADDHIVCAFLGVPILVLPLCLLADNGSQAHH